MCLRADVLCDCYQTVDCAANYSNCPVRASVAAAQMAVLEADGASHCFEGVVVAKVHHVFKSVCGSVQINQILMLLSTNNKQRWQPCLHFLCEKSGAIIP